MCAQEDPKQKMLNARPAQVVRAGRAQGKEPSNLGTAVKESQRQSQKPVTSPPGAKSFLSRPDNTH